MEDNEDVAKMEEFLQTKIKSQVETYFNEMNSKQATSPNAQEQAQKELRDIISPIVDPDIRQSRFDAADAKDYTRFYRENPDVDVDEVEKTFKALADAGRPTTRADISRYLTGKRFEADPTKFMSEMTERQKKQVERAVGASDMGFAGLDKAKNDPSWNNFAQNSVEDMEKALDGITF